MRPAAPPPSQDHHAFARHNKSGTLLRPRGFMNNNKVAMVDAAKMAAAAEQAEAKQKAKATKEAATKGVAEDAPPAKATKVEA
eukprot:scaffold35855_cov21-Phaeocystis_antarctica.AAC.1